MEHGKAIEIEEVRRQKESGIWRGPRGGGQLRFRDQETDTSGEIDSFVHDLETDLVVPTEIKSIYGYYASQQVFGYKGKRVNRPPKPKLEYMPQCMLYLLYTGAPYMFHIYIERGDGLAICFVLKLVEHEGRTAIAYWTPGEEQAVVIPSITIEGIRERQEQLRTAIETKQLPPCDYEDVYSSATKEVLIGIGELTATTKVEGHWMCSYCKHAKRCRNICRIHGRGAIDDFPTVSKHDPS